MAKMLVNGKSKSSRYFALPWSIIQNEHFTKLSPIAKALFIDLAAQYNGFNNGDLCASWSVMKKRGWKSKATLQKAINELLSYGLIIMSRYGGKFNRIANLYAFTFLKIHECNGKIQIKPTKAPLGAWKNPEDYPDVKQILFDTYSGSN